MCSVVYAKDTLFNYVRILMYTTRQNSTLKWFTIVEVLIAISVIAIWFAWIFVLIQNSNRIIHQTQAKITTINIAREGVEIMHNIRDTNRQRRPARKDACWLKIDPLYNDDEDCSNDERIQVWRYRIQKQTNEQQYFSLQSINISWFQQKENALQYRMDTQLCPEWMWRTECDDDTKTTIILRAIEVLWLYDKTAETPNQQIDCINGNNISCSNDTPKELRFCVHTHYISDIHSHTKLCSLITNFQE